MIDDPLTNETIGAAIQVHRELGPGLLESAYSAALAIELAVRRIPFERELPVPVVYRGEALDVHYRIDFLVRGQLVLEIKSVEKILPIHKAQLITYLKLGGYQLGLLLNFSAPMLKDGLRRFVVRTSAFSAAPCAP